MSERPLEDERQLTIGEIIASVRYANAHGLDGREVTAREALAYCDEREVCKVCGWTHYTHIRVDSGEKQAGVCSQYTR
jgi:hypothetical protein